MDAALRNLTEILQRLTNQRDSVEQEIHRTFSDLQKMLDLRKSVLLMEVEVNYTLQHEVLEEQLRLLLQAQEQEKEQAQEQAQAQEKEQVQEQAQEQAQDGALSGCSLTGEALRSSSEVEDLATRPLPLRPQELGQLRFTAETDGLCSSIRRLGSIITGGVVAKETGASGEGLRRCTVGRATCVTVTAKERGGRLCLTGGAVLTAELNGADGGLMGEGEVIDHKDGTYDVMYTLSHEGQYRLALRLNGQHISGSPFSVRATKHTQKPENTSPGRGRRATNQDDLILRIGSRGRNRGEFSNLQGVATSHTGNIVITDSTNQCVQIFSSDGQFKRRFGVRGRSPGQLQHPTGIAIHPNGDIIIADYGSKWVNIFSSGGKFKSKMGSGKLMGPKGVCVDRKGNIIVVDNKTCSVSIFQTDGKLIRRFGSPGNGDRQLAGPHFAAVNQRNEIIVTDFHNHSVKVFTAEGQFLMKFGGTGGRGGQFNGPTGVAVDSNGNIMVADWGNSRIQVFDSRGSFLSFINTSADPLFGPQGLAVTSDSQILIADSGNHCVKVYRFLQ